MSSHFLARALAAALGALGWHVRERPAHRSRRHRALRARRADAARFAALTDREAAVLVDLMHGRSAAEIAACRPVAVATVRSQLAAILRKLDVGSQAAAVAMAYRSCCDNRVLPAARFHQNYG